MPNLDLTQAHSAPAAAAGAGAGSAAATAAKPQKTKGFNLFDALIPVLHGKVIPFLDPASFYEAYLSNNPVKPGVKNMELFKQTKQQTLDLLLNSKQLIEKYISKVTAAKEKNSPYHFELMNKDDDVTLNFLKDPQAFSDYLRLLNALLKNSKGWLFVSRYPESLRDLFDFVADAYWQSYGETTTPIAPYKINALVRELDCIIEKGYLDLFPIEGLSAPITMLYGELKIASSKEAVIDELRQRFGAEGAQRATERAAVAARNGSPLYAAAPAAQATGAAAGAGMDVKSNAL